MERRRYEPQQFSRWLPSLTQLFEVSQHLGRGNLLMCVQRSPLASLALRWKAADTIFATLSFYIHSGGMLLVSACPGSMSPPASRTPVQGHLHQRASVRLYQA